MSEKQICPICGAPTRVYMGNARKDKLCAKHADELKAGKIIMCDKCEKWHSIEEPCVCAAIKYTELPSEGFEKCILCGIETNGYAFCKECWRKYTNEKLIEILNGNTLVQPNQTANEINSEEKIDFQQESNDYVEQEKNACIIINENNKSKCITCGKQTDGLLFCATCYSKYKNKELLFRIKNCTSVELLDADYEGRYTCKDGHIVKSKSERDIDNHLFDKNIPHAYEKELPYGATEKETLHPDFYLPNYLGKEKHLYIEHWGYNENNIQYTKTKKFKMPIYKALCDNKSITLICTYEKTDMNKIDTVLDRKLNKSFIKENEINFEE